jgi:elongation factor 1 alpha-like protein
VQGKSTLVGNFLYKLGAGVTQRQIHNNEKKSGEQGKGSFALAWVMDESESEREHGVTIGLAER